MYTMSNIVFAVRTSITGNVGHLYGHSQLIPSYPKLLFTSEARSGVCPSDDLTRGHARTVTGALPAEDEAPIEAYITEVASAPLPPPQPFYHTLIRPHTTRAGAMGSDELHTIHLSSHYSQQDTTQLLTYTTT
ncbi:hypothetical protein Tco_1264697 [Tanacetum coccineum]